MNNKNIIVGVVVVILLIIGIFFFKSVTGGLFRKTTTVTLGNQKLTLEVVSKRADMEKGLSGRRSLAQNRGMVFLFNTSDYHAFWMKQMQFPIDIIYVQDKKIVSIFDSVPAPTKNTSENELPVYMPTAPANRVIEVNAGLAKKNNVKVGDTVDLSL